MRIIHCADLHIDSKMESSLGSEKARTRKKELINTFERMVEYATNNDVKVIIIAGDMFDSSRVTIKSKEQIFDIIKSHPQIEFLYLAGNHDEENIISSLADEYSNLKIFNDNWTTFKYDNIAITGVKLNSKDKNIYETLDLSKDDYNIVVLHGQIIKYNTSKSNAEIINLSKLKNKYIDYLALGHFHSYIEGKLDDRGIYCYSGCIEGRGFDECGDKGFVLLDINDGKLNKQFISIAKRKLNEIEFDISGIDNWFDIERKILDSIKNIKKSDMIKIVLIGKFKLSLVKQISHLEERLNDIYYFAKIKDKSSLEINAKDFENDLSLKGEFIREVLSSNLTDDEKEKVILIGINAINGEELK